VLRSIITDAEPSANSPWTPSSALREYRGSSILPRLTAGTAPRNGGACVESARRQRHGLSRGDPRNRVFLRRARGAPSAASLPVIIRLLPGPVRGGCLALCMPAPQDEAAVWLAA